MLEPQDFPSYFAPPLTDEGPGFRAQRSIRMLEEETRFTLDALVSAANETRVEMADRLLDDLIAAAGQDERPRVREAAGVLAAWDRRTEADSRGAVLFLFWGNLVTAAARASGASFFTTSWSEQKPLDTPDGFADPAVAVAALADAAAQVQAGFGALDVSWGDAVRLRVGALDLPAVGGPGDPFGIFRAVAPVPDEDGRLRAIAGDTFIAAVEFADPVRAHVLLTYGNASQPGSPHVGDQLPLFARKEMRPAWLTRQDVEANLERRDLFSPDQIGTPIATPEP
jgi:acyl-homoserine-lactone acylase